MKTFNENINRYRKKLHLSCLTLNKVPETCTSNFLTEKQGLAIFDVIIALSSYTLPPSSQPKLSFPPTPPLRPLAAFLDTACALRTLPSIKLQLPKLSMLENILCISLGVVTCNGRASSLWIVSLFFPRSHLHC